MKENILVSIIVASYNYGRYLRENLESLHNQTYKNIEVIVMDDGSTDNSLEIINEYVNKDSRFKLITHENNANKGLTVSLQKALNYCKGEYIAFCESDDYWDIHHIEEKVNYINSNPEADVVVCDYEVFGTSKKLVDSYKNDEGCINLFNYLRNLKKPKEIFFDTFKMWAFPTFSIVMVRKEKLQQCNWDVPSKNCIDIWLWKQLMLKTKTGYVDKKLTFYRRNNDSLVVMELGVDEYNSKLDEILKPYIKKAPVSMSKIKYELRQMDIRIRKYRDKYIKKCI